MLDVASPSIVRGFEGSSDRCDQTPHSARLTFIRSIPACAGNTLG